MAVPRRPVKKQTFIISDILSLYAMRMSFNTFAVLSACKTELEANRLNVLLLKSTPFCLMLVVLLSEKFFVSSKSVDNLDGDKSLGGSIPNFERFPGY